MDTNDHHVNDDGPHKSPIGERIRAERLRLGLSQALFANKVKVHRKTQINYETGERKPDTDYLEAIAKEGVDVGYVLTGNSTHEAKQVYSNILDAIMVELELYKGFGGNWETIYEAVLAEWRTKFSDKTDLAPTGGDMIRALIHRSPKFLGGADEIADLLNHVEFVAETEGRTLSSDQKARAVLTLFRHRKISGIGYVELRMVQEAIKKTI